MAEKKENSGFIVHPGFTGNNKYHASYGNHNKKPKSFKTMQEAKRYLANQGVKKAMYDAPNGIRTVKTTVRKAKKPVRRIRKSIWGFF